MSVSATLFFFTMIVTVAGCGQSTSDKEAQAERERTYGPAMLGEVLVEIEGQAITELDLELAIERTAGSAGLFQLDETARKKILESLVMSKALALRKNQGLSLEELARVDRNVMAYRDELLTKKYLRENVSAAPVSEAMVKAYYEENADRFGASVQKEYELLQAKGKLSGVERNSIIAAFDKAKQENDWSSFAERLKAEKLPVDYTRGAMQQGTLAPAFERVIKPLQKGDVSAVFFMRKLPALVRVVKVTQGEALPLQEVRADIRKQLAPMQLKKAIRRSADDIMKTMAIDYQ